MSAASASTSEVRAPKPTAAPVVAVAAAAHPVSAGGAGNVIPFKLADIGEGIAEVELMQWFVKVCL